VIMTAMPPGFPELKYVLLLLSHCFIFICFLPFARCYVLINCFVFFNLFGLCLFSCFLCFAFYFVSHVFVHYLCIISPLVYSCLFSIYVQFYRPPPPGGKPIAVNKYHTISQRSFYQLSD
jgi:hypothetical protein